MQKVLSVTTAALERAGDAESHTHTPSITVRGVTAAEEVCSGEASHPGRACALRPVEPPNPPAQAQDWAPCGDNELALTNKVLLEHSHSVCWCLVKAALPLSQGIERSHR